MSSTSLVPMDIVTQARTWLGTRFQHQGRVKQGVDCLGLIMGVAGELGLKDKHGKLFASHDEVTYPKQPSGAYITAKLCSLLDEVPLDKAEPGHLALFTIADNPQHLAILTDYNESGARGLIHCDARSKRVVEHRLDDAWQSRLFKNFRISGTSLT
jgi:cell wall-associated NlpC family hydrolase